MYVKPVKMYKCEICGFESTFRFAVETCEKLCKETAEESNKQEESGLEELDCNVKENETKGVEQNEVQSERQ